jgi:hypothetical protein
MTDLVERGRRVVEALERGDVEAVAGARAERLADWEPEKWMRGSWEPRMFACAGGGRRVVDGWRVHDQLVRFRVEGERGQAFVTVLLAEDGFFGVNVSHEVRDGTFGISIACADDERDELRAFWERLVDAPLGFGEGQRERPRWPDPAHPQQLHLDVLVADLSTAEAEVLANGATKLRDSGAFRVYADPAGHPFCLYASDQRSPDRLGVLARVVFDCPDPLPMATFWSAFLDLPDRLEDAPDRIVIAGSDRRLPMLAMQRVENHQPPRWPDPQYPAQLHLDVLFDDRRAREQLVLQLGATKLPPQGGSCAVYADPAGHPFCLCMTGE